MREDIRMFVEEQVEDEQERAEWRVEWPPPIDPRDISGQKTECVGEWNRREEEQDRSVERVRRGGCKVANRTRRWMRGDMKCDRRDE